LTAEQDSPDKEETERASPQYVPAPVRKELFADSENIFLAAHFDYPLTKKLKKDYDILVKLGAQNALTAVTAEIIADYRTRKGDRSMPTKSKTPAPVTSDQTVSEAFATIMRHNFVYLGQWEDTARTWEDIEGVHQVRVAIRRMRSALSLFRDAIPKAASGHWADEMRWCAGELGMARDLDVFIAEGLSAVTGKMPLGGCEGLLRLAEQRRAQTYEEQVRGMLDSDRYSGFKTGFQSWYEGREWENAKLKKKQAKCLAKNLVPFSRDLMDKQERKVLAAGSHVDRTDTDAMHRLRIECKKLRYAAEFFRPLFAGMDGFIDHMKGLQDLLGLMNDVSVTSGLLEDLTANATDREVFVYAGGLIGWRTCDYHHMLDRFDLYWEELVEAKHPWWKKSALIQANS
jgi:CHAD domain-containing protein